MDCLQISGMNSTGKSTTIFRLYSFFRNRRYTIVHQEPAVITQPSDNIRVVMKNPVDNRVLLLNSASDYPDSGQELALYYQRFTSIDVLVTSIRDEGIERTEMENAVGSFLPRSVLEVPLAKVTRRTNLNATTEYLDRAEQLCIFLLLGQPFNL